MTNSDNIFYLLVADMGDSFRHFCQLVWFYLDTKTFEQVLFD